MKPERSRILKTILIIAAVVPAAITIMYVVPFGLLFYSVVPAKFYSVKEEKTYDLLDGFDATEGNPYKKGKLKPIIKTSVIKSAFL